MKPHLLIILLLLLVVALVPQIRAELLYDVNFGSPPHTVGMPPALGGGPPPRDVPTAINFGDPLVVAALGALIDQPCQFGNGTTGYDQLQFGISESAGGFSKSYDTYTIAMDVLIVDLTSDLVKLFLDAPSVNYLSFHENGDIRTFPGSVTIGTFVPGVPIFVEMEIDIPAVEWSVWLDDSHAYTGPANAEALRTIRIHVNGSSEAVTMAIDNFTVIGGDEPVDVGEHALVTDARLLAPYPNPSSGSVWIGWVSPTNAARHIEVVSVSGRIVWSRSLRSGLSGEGGVLWNGTDAKGRRLPAGIYFMRANAGSEDLGTRTIVLRE